MTTLPLPQFTDDLLDRLVLGTSRDDLDDAENTTACWHWRGRDGHPLTYRPRIRIGGHHVLVARLWYLAATGDDPGEDSIEHTCAKGSSGCVNPAHLVAMPMVDNVLAATSNGAGALHARQTTCLRGHVDWRVYRDGKGRSHRQCRTCEHDRERRA